MDNQLFRKKSLERISSPEALHDYMRVTGPRLWMILGAILLLLAGFIVYASTATMENVLPVRIEVTTHSGLSAGNGEGIFPSTSYSVSLPAAYQGSIKADMEVRLGSHRGKTDLITVSSEEDSQEMWVLIKMDDPSSIHLPDGVYDGEIVMESVSPLSFLWN